MPKRLQADAEVTVGIIYFVGRSDTRTEMNERKAVGRSAAIEPSGTDGDTAAAPGRATRDPIRSIKLPRGEEDPTEKENIRQ